MRERQAQEREKREKGPVRKSGRLKKSSERVMTSPKHFGGKIF